MASPRESAELPLQAARAHLRLGEAAQAQAILGEQFHTRSRAEAPESLDRIDLLSGRPDRTLAHLRGSRSSARARMPRLVLLACAGTERRRARQAPETVRLVVEAAQPDWYLCPFQEGFHG